MCQNKKCGAAGAVPHLFAGLFRLLGTLRPKPSSPTAASRARLFPIPPHLANGKPPARTWRSQADQRSRSKLPSPPIPSRCNGSTPVHGIIAAPASCRRPESHTGQSPELMPGGECQPRLQRSAQVPNRNPNPDLSAMAIRLTRICKILQHCPATPAAEPSRTLQSGVCPQLRVVSDRRAAFPHRVHKIKIL